jgi:hypothetical protein
MKNWDFIKTQTEKVISELFLASSGVVNQFALEGFVSEQGTPNMQMDDATKFIHYKITILEQIKEKTEQELKSILETEKKKLCISCQKGIETFEIRCRQDFDRFVHCEYIMRSLL